MDLPGHGKSAGEPFEDIGSYGGFIQQFIAQLEIVNYCVIGHSMGGAIALNISINGSLPPKAVILVGAAPRFPVNKKILNEFKTGLKPEHFIKAAYDKNLPAGFLKLALEEFATTPALTYFRDLLACSNFNVSEAIKTLSIPSLWLLGSSDRLISNNDVLDTISGVHGCQYKIIDRAGHMIHLEQPEMVNNEIYSFLSSL